MKITKITTETATLGSTSSKVVVSRVRNEAGTRAAYTLRREYSMDKPLQLSESEMADLLKFVNT